MTRRTLTILFFLGLFVPAATVSATTVYKWTDSNGVVHYSDQPGPNSHKIHVGSPQTVPAPAAPAAPSSAGAPSRAQRGYSTLKLNRPAQKQTIRNNRGRITVAFALAPPLHTRRGDRVQVLLDGKVRRTTTGGSVTLDNVDRGTHTVQVRVVGPSGKVLIHSGVHTVYLKRTFIHRSSNLMMNRAPSMQRRPAP